MLALKNIFLSSLKNMGQRIDMRIYNFSRAKLLLRKKKYQEGLLARTDGQLDNLERLVHDLEFAQVEKQVLMHNGIHYCSARLLTISCSKFF